MYNPSLYNPYFLFCAAIAAYQCFLRFLWNYFSKIINLGGSRRVFLSEGFAGNPTNKDTKFVVPDGPLAHPIFTKQRVMQSQKSWWHFTLAANSCLITTLRNYFEVLSRFYAVWRLLYPILKNGISEIVIFNSHE